MNVLITGGTGLIGSRLSASLTGDGHRVIILSRSPQAKRGNLPEGVEVVRWDGSTPDGWGHLINEVDAVINLAGESIGGEGFPPTRWTEARKELIRSSRANAANALMAAIRDAEKKPSVFVQASAIGYYGAHGDEVVLESDRPGTDFAALLLAAGEMTTGAVEEMGIRWVAIRTALVLSKDGGIFPNLVLPVRMFGSQVGSGNQYYSWIHMDDQIRAMRFVLENKDASGPFNLSAPEPVTNREMHAAIAKALKWPAFVPVPGFALKLALGEVSSLVLEGQRVVPEKLRARGFEFKYTTIDAAVADLLDKS